MRLLAVQLLPLIVFIVVDSVVTDVRISIGAAMVFAAGQLAVAYAKTRRIDWFVVLDAGLVAVLGGVAIASQNELFFKVKPAIVEGLTVLFMLALVLAPDRFLVGYFGRMMPGRALQPEALGRMKTLLGWMCAWIALHIGAVLYTAFFSSRRAWAFVSGPGFYLLVAPLIFGVPLVRRFRRRAARAGAGNVTPGP
jgi:intracellular septation protein A